MHPYYVQLSCEIKHLLGQVAVVAKQTNQREEVAVVQQFIKRFNMPREKMFVEDLAALEKLTEESIVEELKHRLNRGHSYSFIGDVLVSLNSNDLPSEFPRSVRLIFTIR